MSKYYLSTSKHTLLLKHPVKHQLAQRGPKCYIRTEAPSCAVK